MGRLVVTEFVTLDGVGQAPGGPDEDREGGFRHGGWQAPFVDARSAEAILRQAQRTDALLLGRRTYDIFAGYWPTQPADNPFALLLNRVPRHVASRTLHGPLAWSGSSVLGGDLAAGVRELTRRHDELHVIGSLDLVQSLLRLRLVDTMSLWVYPVLLGAGKRVFAEGTVPASLRLIAAEPYPSGAVHLTYEAAGEPTYGTVDGADGGDGSDGDGDDSDDSDDSDGDGPTGVK